MVKEYYIMKIKNNLMVILKMIYMMEMENVIIQMAI